ncbi:hypothetical protein BDW75DRAFT_27565 [Aspergillus navahoensis]
MANPVDSYSMLRGLGVKSCQGRSPRRLWGSGAWLLLVRVVGARGRRPPASGPCSYKASSCLLYFIGLQPAARLEHLLQVKPFGRGSQLLRLRFG